MAKYRPDQWTDEELAKLEARITEEYGKAWNELKKKADDYFKTFEKRDKALRKALDEGKVKLPAGETADSYYQKWRRNQLAIGKRWDALRDEMARRITECNKVAAAYVNDITPGIWSLNRNYECYVMESLDEVAEIGVSFTIFDEQTIRRLIVNRDKYMLPRYWVAENRDVLWNYRKLQSGLIAGILAGDSIDDIADRFQHTMSMNRTTAITWARTAVTGAQNGGRQYAFQEAHEMGIKVEKKWVATKDMRTRHSHQELDGEIVPFDLVFSNGLRFPGDPLGKMEEIARCRCTMYNAADRHLEKEKRMIRVQNPEWENAEPDERSGIPRTVVVGEMNYKEWLKWKQSK